MRIGIDGYNLAMPHGTGVATYGLVLARTLKAAGHEVEGLFGLDVGGDPATREVMLYDLVNRDPHRQRTRAELNRERRMIFRLAAPPFKVRPALEVPITDRVEKSAFADRLPAFDRLYSVPHLFEVARRHFQLYGRFLRVSVANPPEVMHWTYPVPVRLEGAANIYTIHDIVPLRLPYTTLDAKQEYFRLLSRCIAESAQICTVSEASARDIVEQFGVAPGRVTNCYQASPLPAAAFAQPPEEDAAMIEGVFGLPHRGYFLYFGALEPKKNIGRLLEAYLSIRSDHPLVVVGSRSWSSEEELRLLANGAAGYGGNSRQRIIKLEHLPRSLLNRLIRGARAVAFPSLYEGFGLPVLEAIQLGTPVLVSNTGSLPEVAGDAAVYVDPYDVNSIAAALQRLDGDDALREDLARRGPVQAETFTPARYAERLDALYAAARGAR